MTTATISGQRRDLLAKLHVGKKKLGLDDDTYRDWLKATIGLDSAKGASDGQLVVALEAMKKLGFADRPKRQADSPHAKKCRALWIALYNLGVVVDPTDAALTAFARRQVKIDSLKWIKASQAATVIEALKGWLVREGVSQDGDVIALRVRLIREQWRRLYDLHAVCSGTRQWEWERQRWARLSRAEQAEQLMFPLWRWADDWRRRRRLPAVHELEAWQPAELDEMVGDLGRKLRSAQVARAGAMHDASH